MSSLIRKVIDHYTDTGGDDCIVCPLPDHVEDTASFNIYDDQNSFHCYGKCGTGGDCIDFVKLKEGIRFTAAKQKVLSILGITEAEYMETKQVSEVVVEAVVPEMSKEEFKALRAQTGYEANNYRGIKDEYNKFYGHLSKVDADGNVLARYYPETNSQGRLSGYKCRNHPKDFSFGKLGSTGNKSQLSGQVKFTSRGKYLLIVGGEEDKVAAYQMLADNQKDKEYDSIAVVSPTSGETSCAKQVAANFSFCDQFDYIHIGMDNDEAGRKAAEMVAALLPKEKVRMVLWSGKDPNKMLQDGKEKQFCRDFYAGKPLINSGIKESTGLMSSVREELMRPRIQLPEHWSKVEEATRGGFLQGRIYNIIGDTSVGKTTHINDLVYFWMFNAPEKVGVVSLENTDGQYTIDLLSLHLEKNLMWIGEGQKILDYLDDPKVKVLYDDLLTNEFGQPRFSILDERDGDIKMLEKQAEKLISQYGCRILVIDVLTDILRGSNAEHQEDHMKWQKQIVKSGVTIFNVLHTRKPQNSDGGWRKATEYDALGSGTFVQSAAGNIVISRDKMNPDPLIKNTTHVDIPKMRGGDTGEICKLVYDAQRRRTVEYDVYMRSIGNSPAPQQEEYREYMPENPYPAERFEDIPDPQF